MITNDTAQAELDAIIQATVARGPVLDDREYNNLKILPPERIAEMRTLHAGGGISLRKLARQFGVSHRTAGRMLA
jgi:hypothetical protein